MKESSGELGMVVVTLIAIAAIAVMVRALLPEIQQYVNEKWETIKAEP